MDIAVVVTDDAQKALAQSDALSGSDTLRYAGTARGLAGLSADLYPPASADGSLVVPAMDRDRADLLQDWLVGDRIAKPGAGRVSSRSSQLALAERPGDCLSAVYRTVLAQDVFDV